MAEYPKNINALSRRERVRIFTKVASETIAKGKFSLDEFNDTIEDSVDDEFYELAQGIDNAIKKFDGQMMLDL